jgi:hypothetical protein
MSLVVPILVLGVLASLSPTTILVFILLLGTARARANAAAFLIGWSASLTFVFAITYAACTTPDDPERARHTSPHSETALCRQVRSFSPSCH